jgi:exodeoxyribonuclease V alpha subunit
MPAIRQQAVRVCGELVAFSVRGSDGWGIGALRTTVETVGLTGKLVGVRVGETVELEGAWDDHPQYGRRLKVRTCTAVQPETTEGVVAWLASTLPGIGITRARQLVECFGGAEGLWTTIETDPQALCTVDGITAARAEAIRAAYDQHRGNRDHMILLRGWGLTDGQIARCVEQWKSLEAVVANVRANPYQLAQCVYGFGFLRSDAVAMKAGVTYDSPARIAAGVEHVLDEQTGKGHCYLPSGALMTITAKLLGVETRLVAVALRTAVRAGRAVRRGQRVYSARLDRAEEECAQGLRRLLGRAA